MISLKKAPMFCLLMTTALSWATDCVPTKQLGQGVQSPNGWYRVVRVVCSNDAGKALMLLDAKTGARREIYTYTRNVGVVWSPDSRRVAINDYAGSDYTNNIVISVDRDTPLIDLKSRLLQSRLKRDSLSSDHLYLSVKGWKSDSEIELVAWGHDSSEKKGFCECFLVRLEGSVQQCGLDPGARDPEEYCDQIAK